MDFVTAIKTCFTKYVGFAGRAPRSEYWYFTLFLVVVAIALGAAGLDQVGNFFSLVTLLPSLAVGVRRLHDTDRSGWWLLLLLVPLVGMIVLIVWFVKSGTQGANRFGDDPLQPAQSALPPDA
jgi:uncharacterized membrane protein YhaH (DUF805 family)